MLKLAWPHRPPMSWSDKLALKLKRIPGYCNICGQTTLFRSDNSNFREHTNCLRCGSVNRQRQIAAVLLSYIHGREGRKGAPLFSNLKDIPAETRIWNAENTRALHDGLKAHLGSAYTCSEYIDPKMKSGETKNGVLHVDMQNTQFEDNSLDYVLSSDILEHMPDPWKALKEVYRILKPGGCHIFTVPFYRHRFTNEKRAVLKDTGEIEYFRKPWYHDDPLRPEGVLTYTVFAPELFCEMEHMGYESRWYFVHSMLHGLLYSGLVLVGRKAIPPDYEKDEIFG